jgi:hypothetical protein
VDEYELNPKKALELSLKMVISIATAICATQQQRQSPYDLSSPLR